MRREIDSSVLDNAVELKTGTTCVIVRTVEGKVYKLYNGAYDYLCDSGEYRLEVDKVNARLDYLISKRDSVKKSDLPLEILVHNGLPVGVEIEYYEDCITLKEYLENNVDVDKGMVKNQLLGVVDELISHDIIPTDPHFENFVVRDEMYGLEILPIDLDDQYVEVFPPGSSLVFRQSSISACYRVIDLSFADLQKNINK